jgi:hypothetical protein
MNTKTLEELRIIARSGVDVYDIKNVLMCAWDYGFTEIWNYIFDNKEFFLDMINNTDDKMEDDDSWDW